MTTEIVKAEDTYAVVRRMAEGIEKRVQDLVHDVQASQQLSPVAMQELIIRMTGAMETISREQRQIRMLLENQAASNLCR
ncbi:MAG: hypothetical protein ABIF77_00090 [bacterium]